MSTIEESMARHPAGKGREEYPWVIEQREARARARQANNDARKVKCPVCSAEPGHFCQYMRDYRAGDVLTPRVHCIKIQACHDRVVLAVGLIAWLAERGLTLAEEEL